MIRIKFTRTGVLGIGRRDLQEVGRRSILAAAKLWYGTYLKKHFTPQARYRYGYAPRKPGYRKDKRNRGIAGSDKVRSIGEDAPLVWSGRSRESALGGSNITATAKNFKTYSAEVPITAPTLNFVKSSREELTTVNVDEELAMQDVFAEVFERELNKRGRTRRKTKSN